MNFNHRTDVDFNKHQLLNALLQIIGGDHSSPEEALVWWDSAAKQIAYYDGDQVRRIPYSGGTDAATFQGQNGAYYLNRANHTGTQLANTISDLSTILSGYVTDGELQTAVANLVGSSADSLNTLQELGDALNDDPNFHTTIINLIAARMGKFTSIIGDGAALTYNVDHNLGTRAVIVSLTDAGTFQDFQAGITRPTVNRIVVDFDAPAPAGDSVLVTVGG